MKGKDDTAERGRQLQEVLATAIKEKLGIPVITIDPASLESFFTQISQGEPGLKRHFTDQELKNEIGNFIAGLVVARPDESKLPDLIEDFTTNLKTEKQYEAILLLNGFVGLPVGTQLGDLEIIQPDKSRKLLNEHIDRLVSKGRLYPANSTWCRIAFKSHKTTGLQEELNNALELPYSIVTFIMHMKLDLKDTVGAIFGPNGNIWFLGSDFHFGPGWAKFREDLVGKQLSALSSISTRPTRTKLEERVIRAIQIFWLAEQAPRIKVGFLLLIVAMESLLLTKNDNDYLGTRLAEKTAFLLENEGEKRLRLFRLVKKYYDKRSRLMHEGEKDISESDRVTAREIFRALVFKLIEFSGKYDRLEVQSNPQDKDGLDDYINHLRFR